MVLLPVLKVVYLCSTQFNELVTVLVVRVCYYLINHFLTHLRELSEKYFEVAF